MLWENEVRDFQAVERDKKEGVEFWIVFWIV